MKTIAQFLFGVLVLLVLTVAAGCQNVGAEPAATQPNPARPTVGRQELPGGMTVEVRGLRVVAPGSDEQSSEMRAFSWNPGTTVAVCIQRPAGGIIGIDREASKVAVFRDNQGADLWNGAKAGEFSHSSLDMMPQVAEDGTAILFEVDAQGIPRPGSTTFTLQGTVELSVAADKTSFTAKDVSVEPGSQFKAGSRTIEVTQTGAPAWGGENAFAATLQLQGDVEDIVEIAFLDAGGNKLPADRQGSLWSGSGENRINQWEYVFESRPTGPVQVVVTQWTDMTRESVPLNLTFGAGL
jgi:hypothetical protein